jgi:hypothetical protein
MKSLKQHSIAVDHNQESSVIICIEPTLPSSACEFQSLDYAPRFFETRYRSADSSMIRWISLDAHFRDLEQRFCNSIPKYECIMIKSISKDYETFGDDKDRMGILRTAICFLSCRKTSRAQFVSGLFSKLTQSSIFSNFRWHFRMQDQE